MTISDQCKGRTVDSVYEEDEDCSVEVRFTDGSILTVTAYCWSERRARPTFKESEKANP